jgi:CHAT domain-containing protein/tetratricopeptide (TPR) repeat protein
MWRGDVHSSQEPNGEGIMAGFLRSAVIALVLAACWGALGFAQQGDIGALQKRFRELFAAGDYAAALMEAQKLEAAVKERFGTQHERYADVLVAQANVLRTLGRYPEAEGLAKRAVATAEQAKGTTHPVVATALTSLGLAYELQGRYGEAEPLYRRALAIRQLAGDASPVPLARALNNLAVLQRKQGRYRDAEELGRRVLALLEKAKGDNEAETALALNNLAVTYEAQARYGEAEADYRRALAIYERIRGANHPDVATALMNVAGIYRLQGKTGDTESLLQRALAIRERVFGRDHPQVAQSLNGLALLYESQARFGEAQGLYERALAIREKALGPDHPDVAIALNNLASNFAAQGRYQEAAARYRRALAIRERALGPEHPGVAETLGSMANLARLEARYAEAEEFYRRALSVRQQALGADHPLVANTLNGMAILNRVQGRLSEAENLYRRVLAIREKALGADHPDVAQALNNLAVAFESQGRYGEAETYYGRALAIYERARGPNHPDVALALSNLAGLYRLQGRNDDAEGLFKRALAIREQVFGKEHPAVAQSYNSLAILYRLQRRYDDAEELYRRALAIREKTLGKDHPEVGQTLNNLGVMNEYQLRRREAEDYYKRALAIREKAFGADHPEVAQTLNNLARLYRVERRYREAEEPYRRALAIREKSLGPDHPDVAQTLNDLSALAIATDDREAALAYSRRATAAVLAHAAIDAPRVAEEERSGGLVEQRAAYFRRHVANLALAARRGAGLDPEPGREAFETAQWALHSATAAAVQQVAARFASGSGALADLVREKQDLAAAWRESDRNLLVTLAKTNAKSDRNESDTLRRQRSEIEVKLSAVTARLEREFPDYAALTGTAPLGVAEAQKLLGTDEALAFWLTSDAATYVFAVTHEGFAWQTIPLGERDLGAKVAAFRRGLDVADLARAIEAGRSELFDLGFAHDLYRALIGPIEGLVKAKKNLIVVPSGALTGLPFHLLVTEKPPPIGGDVKDLGLYRDAAWLLKRHAVSVLPSVASLKALRAFGPHEQGTKPMIGFGDPTFAPSQGPPSGQRGKGRTALATRAYSDFWQGSGVDRRMLSLALPPLPETADELRTVAARLGRSGSDIFLGRDASEAAVKRAHLADYRIVYFATHGLVAGDIKDLAEPSLALALPPQPSDLDDGLLTASEIAQLKLNADWVVLSACNTAAGEKPGAEALSGLARAFFYAGARALLVSHWTVESKAAARLTISAFNALKNDPAIGRAEAVRRAMLDYLNDRSNPQNAYPGYWGPFSVVGEGAAR